jgi:hypothetical protein
VYHRGIHPLLTISTALPYEIQAAIGNGQRFLVKLPVQNREQPPITVVVNLDGRAQEVKRQEAEGRSERQRRQCGHSLSASWD